jgi:hypothetical protein
VGVDHGGADVGVAEQLLGSRILVLLLQMNTLKQAGFQLLQECQGLRRVGEQVQFPLGVERLMS